MTFFKLVLISFIALTFTASPVVAADKKEKSVQKETPISKWLKAENELLDSLPYTNKKVFFVFRNKHSVIRSIGIIQGDIKNAVKACGKANKDLKKPMRNRFRQWENAVLPIVKEARKFLNKELKEQEAFHVSDYRHVMKLNDKAYNFSEEKVTKQPVTTKEACEGLLASMDRTEDTMVSLLQDILLPEEVVRKRIERAKKAEEKAKEKAAKN